MSPVIHRERGYTFYFVMADLSEPPHVHVGKVVADGEMMQRYGLRLSQLPVTGDIRSLS